MCEIFEKLVAAKDDPEEFQKIRDEIWEEFYATVPEEKLEKLEKLKQFQWNIDKQLRFYKDPIARMNKMVELFWSGVTDFKKVLDEAKDIDLKP